MFERNADSPREKRVLMTPEEVATELQVGLVKVRKMFRTEELQGFKLGGKLWRMFRTDFEAYLRKRKPSTESD